MLRALYCIQKLKKNFNVFIGTSMHKKYLYIFANFSLSKVNITSNKLIISLELISQLPNYQCHL